MLERPRTSVHGSFWPQNVVGKTTMAPAIKISSEMKGNDTLSQAVTDRVMWVCMNHFSVHWDEWHSSFQIHIHRQI